MKISHHFHAWPSSLIFSASTLSLIGAFFVALAVVIPIGSAWAEVPLVALAHQKDQSLVRHYDLEGDPLEEFTVQSGASYRYLAARWGSASFVAALIESGAGKTVRFYSNSGVVMREVILPKSSVNSVFAADLDGSGFDDFVAIEHQSARAVAHVFYDPGQQGSLQSTIPLPLQALYYAPAYAGTSCIGLLAFSPKSTAAATLAAKKKKRKKNKKKGGKSPKVKKNQSGIVHIIGWDGEVKSAIEIRGAIDGQIFPFSYGTLPGFGLRDKGLVRFFDAQGGAVSSIAVPLESDVVVADFENRGSFSQLLISGGATTRLVNIESAGERTIELKEFPNQEDALEAQISALRQELVDSFRQGAPLTKIVELKNQIDELEAQKKQFSSGGHMALSLIRLFTGGAGSIEGVCDVVFENPNDGYGGFLMKNSDKDGKIVVLMPGGKNYSKADMVKFGSYKKIEDLKDAGFGNPDKSGYRKHFRGAAPIQRYGKFIFRATLKASPFDDQGQVHCWYIKKPSSRIE